jgi:hypothetical protein
MNTNFSIRCNNTTKISTCQPHFIISYTAEEKAKYRSIYAKTYGEVRAKKAEFLRRQTLLSHSTCDSKSFE